MTRDEINELLVTADVGGLPKTDISAYDIMENLTDFDAKRLCGRVGREMASALKRAGLSRAAGKKTTPMHEACRWDNEEALRAVVTVKNCERKNRQGYRPMEVCAQNVSPHCAELLLEKGADPTRSTPTGGTALHMAAQTGGPVLRKMRRHLRGEVIDTPDEYGRTPLMQAVAARRMDAAYALLMAGADPDASDQFDQTPRSVARAKGFEDILELM